MATAKKMTALKKADVVDAYRALSTLKIGEFEKKEDMFIILNAANALKPVAKAFDDFVEDVQKRLKPEGFDAIQEKSQRFDKLSDDEKREVNKVLQAYQKDVNDCVKDDLQKEVLASEFKHLSEASFVELIKMNKTLELQTLMVLQTIIA